MVADGGSRGGSGAAYTRFAEEMDINSVELEVRECQEPGKFGAIKNCLCSHRNVLFVILFCVCFFLFGLFLGQFVFKGATRHMGNPVVPPDGNSTEHHEGDGRLLIEMVHQLINTSSLEMHLRKFTKEVHDSGSPGSQHLAQYTTSLWQKYGFNVSSRNYTVKVSRPNRTALNRLVIHDTNSADVVFEAVLDDRTDPAQIPPFCPHSPSASLTNVAPMFINYGTAEDFAYLLNEADQLPLDAGERIVCLYKLGKVQLPILVKRCQEHNGIGVLVYPDPKDYNALGEDAYPSSWWLPSNGTIRASVSPIMGDQATPYLPSIDGVTADPVDYVRLPTLIISSDTAKELMTRMSTPLAPTWWQGGLGIDYYLGKNFQHPNLRMSMEINSVQEERKIQNVFGVITGSVEPDRYIIIGNHRDSLTPGGAEPGTGSAVFMEVTRVASELLKTGWKPKRTIIFASWDGGDDGHVGSTEWVQENIEILHERGLIYINLDEAVSGKYSFLAEGSPLLQKALYAVTQKINCPDDDHPEEMTVYHNWALKYPVDPELAGDDKIPTVFPVGINTDLTPFLHIAGVPSVDLKYTFAKSEFTSTKKVIPKYPVYHTSFDTADYVIHFIDEKFQYMSTMTEIAAGLMLTFSNDIVLPIQVTDYAKSLQRYYFELMNANYDLSEINFEPLDKAIKNLKKTALEFHQNVVLKVDTNDAVAVKEVNDRLVSMDRAFLDISQLHAFSQNVFPQLRHMVYGPSPIGAYDAQGLSALNCAVNEANATFDWTQVHRVLSATIAAVNRAEGTLKINQLFT